MTDKAVVEALKNIHQNDLKQIYSNIRLAIIGFAKNHPITKEKIIDIYQDAVITLRDNAMKETINDLKSEIKRSLFIVGKHLFYRILK
ncbi:hypothetical protein [Psychroserpens luteus]|uniref:Uncharacterized protein n=1 Tax=Psychroserpens luteus TaxID=1434066 RepID=A0ABW5ZTZ5_9FLAO|nr:hypothetical protein [Psychroserpens luteus]